MSGSEQGFSTPRAEEQPTDKKRAQTVHQTHSPKAVSREATRGPDPDHAGTVAGADKAPGERHDRRR